MIRLLITAAAFEAIAGCPPSGPQKPCGRYGAAPAGMVAIWLDVPVVEALRANRWQGESMSDTIIRFAAQEAKKAA